MRKFQKKVENFICENCGIEIKGNGYTNHCPECLYSKHVDVNPGDRAASCGGLMEPEKIELKKNRYVVVHRCLDCGYSKSNKVSSDDNMDEIIRIAGRWIWNL